jgi:integrase
VRRRTGSCKRTRRQPSRGARREEKEPAIFYKEQYKALLYEASDDPRDHAIIMTFLQSGIRLSKLAAVQLEDVDFENRLLTVRQGKGRKDRQIPLVDEEVKALRNYLRYRATELFLDDDMLFLAKNGTSLNVSSVKAIVAKYVKTAGIRKRVSVHTLRHTFSAHKADTYEYCDFAGVGGAQEEGGDTHIYSSGADELAERDGRSIVN